MRPWVRGWWLLVAGTAVTALVAVVTRSLPAAAGAVVAALVTVVAGVMVKRGTEELDEARRARLEMREKLHSRTRGAPPRVRDVTDLERIGGVHLSGDAGVTRFVRRDGSDALEAALREHRFVMVIGESTAGKSRAALEAIRTCLPDHRFVLPDASDRSSVRSARRAASVYGACVIWLDDLERYLGAGGLTAHDLRQLAIESPRSVVVATIRTVARARYDRDDDRLVRGVLELAHEVPIDRRWSAAELERGRHSGDEQILDALEHAGRFGVGEYLTAAPRLSQAAKDAWDPEGGHTRAAALVTAAVDAWCAGWPGALPTDLLRDLHEHYLTSRGGIRLRPEPWEAALSWATSPLFATSSLLVPDGVREGHYTAFDYLADARDADPDAEEIPSRTWTLLIGAADGPACLEIGWVARRRHELEVAERAFRKALDSGVPPAAGGLAILLGDRGSREDTRAAAELIESTLATAPPDTEPVHLLELRYSLAWWTGASGDSSAALAAARDVWRDCRELFGEDDSNSIEAGLSVARWTGWDGDVEGAHQTATELRDHAARLLGPDHGITLSARFEAACWNSAALTDRAEEWRELDIDTTRLLGALDPLTNDTRWNLAGCMRRCGNAEEAVRLLDTIVSDRATIYGAEHPRTLEGHLELAGETGATGHPTNALEAIARLDIGHILGDDHELTLYARYQEALWTGMTGDHENAKELFEHLLADSTRVLGTSDRLTEDITEQLEHSPGYIPRYHLPASW
jgi:tetratricopeptide (TPR) repeat protein